MPGYSDFAKIRARLFADARAHRAAALLVKRGQAREPTALLAVVGAVAALAIWATRETDNGVLPGDGVAVGAAAMQLPHATAGVVVAVLREAKLLRAKHGGLYLVGFVECYGPMMRKRRRDRLRLAQLRAQARDAATARAKNVAATSLRPRGDVAATSQRRRSSVATTSRGRGEERRGESSPPTPLQGAGDTTGGGSASPSVNGAAVAIPSTELAVFEALWRKRARMVDADRAASEALRTALRDGHATRADVEAFNSRLTPSFVELVRQVRITKSMETKQRKEAT